MIFLFVNFLKMKYTAILGCQWGDEGKGKLVDILSSKYDIIGRCTGGANAGHTIKFQDQKHVFHLLPSGILRENTECVIGNGTVICMETLVSEITKLTNLNFENRLFISDRAFVVLPIHKYLDSKSESKLKDKKIGTTKRGIGPAYSLKIARKGLRISDFFQKDITKKIYEFYMDNLSPEDLENFNLEEEVKNAIINFNFLKRFIINLDDYLEKNVYKLNKSILFEGANGALLDIDHGTYPFVTSSNPTIGGISTGFGFPANKINEVIGIVKAYCTRVGAGPFPSELFDQTAKHLQSVGHEYGSTTGRPRRCGWLDLVSLKTMIQKNGVTCINLTKLDVLKDLPYIKVVKGYYLNGRKITYLPTRLDDIDQLDLDYEMFEGFSEDISSIRNFKDLPKSVKAYVFYIQEFLGVPIKYIGVGEKRDDLITLDIQTFS